VTPPRGMTRMTTLNSRLALRKCLDEPSPRLTRYPHAATAKALNRGHLDFNFIQKLTRGKRRTTRRNLACVKILNLGHLDFNFTRKATRGMMKRMKRMTTSTSHAWPRIFFAIHCPRWTPGLHQDPRESLVHRDLRRCSAIHGSLNRHHRLSHRLTHGENLTIFGFLCRERPENFWYRDLKLFRTTRGPTSTST